MMLKLLVLVLCMTVCLAGSKSQRHSHTGELQRYDRHHIPYSITQEQESKLNAGEPVMTNERSGKHGRGIVLQDIAAPPAICMDRIRDLINYPKMVPKAIGCIIYIVKSVNIYDQVRYVNGTEQASAEFKVGLSMLTFTYFLRITFEPKYFTLTWTLDYEFSSDFDDTVGHWQVMPHPTKSDWSRVLYSTAVKVPAWIPEFVITILTKTALIEATTWVRKESESMVQKGLGGKLPAPRLPDLSSCFISDSLGARYETHCSEVEVENREEQEL